MKPKRVQQEKPLARFRVYPENRSLYFLVVIWPTIKAFRRANPGNSNALALCRSYRILRVYGKGDRRRDWMKSILGCIHFPKPHLTIGIIAHEFTHALFSWMGERKISPVIDSAKERSTNRFGFIPRNDPEERCCRAMQEMMRQCVHQLYKRKILP